ncbi:SCP2 sterol-binding domain-containing protein [Pseudomonas sp. F1_0610]|uniref:SCP2 sterol-binding domain-containing protein n=1 Tax=Pseudomonas sp. F1_0610 TaxID=3114284 RepID=UPI0039C0A2FC
MKFRFLLWAMGRLLAKSSKNNPKLQEQLEGKDLVFMLHTFDNKIARTFIVRDQRIVSKSGVAKDPAFSIAFKDATFGFLTLTAKNKQLAFMQGIQNKDIKISGNTALVMWFQGLMKYVMPRKKKPTEKKAA